MLGWKEVRGIDDLQILWDRLGGFPAEITGYMTTYNRHTQTCTLIVDDHCCICLILKKALKNEGKFSEVKRELVARYRKIKDRRE